MEDFVQKNRFFLYVYSLVLCLSSSSQAQDDAKEQPTFGWQKNVVGGLNLSQTSFDNWTQGGENSLAWQLNLNAKFVNEQEKFNWSNTGKFSFGRTKVGNQDSRKSIDEIKLESVLAYKISEFLNPYVAVSGETQSAKGYDYSGDTKRAVSDLFDPAYLIESVGVTFSPNEVVKTRLGAAAKQTITNDFPIPYADDKDTDKIEKTRSEIGAESVTDISAKLSETALFTLKLELFSNLKTVEEVDVHWDNIFTAKVSKYIDVNLNVKLFYDSDISKKRQLKQALMLGLTYTFLE
jgi:hypothetical protein